MLVIVAYAMIPWVMGEGVARLVGGEVEDAVGWLFSRLVFPFFFVWTMRDQRQNWKKEIADCYVQLVEVVLLPQEILR